MDNGLQEFYKERKLSDKKYETVSARILKDHKESLTRIAIENDVNITTVIGFIIEAGLEVMLSNKNETKEFEIPQLGEYGFVEKDNSEVDKFETLNFSNRHKVSCYKCKARPLDDEYFDDLELMAEKIKKAESVIQENELFRKNLDAIRALTYDSSTQAQRAKEIKDKISNIYANASQLEAMLSTK